MSQKIINFMSYQSFIVYAIVLSLFFLQTISFQVHKDDYPNLKTPQTIQIKIDQTQTHPQSINELSFHQFIKTNDRALIYFYVDDCQFCEEFNETFTQMEKVYGQSEKGKQRKISFGKLKLTIASEKIYKEFNIEAVPDIKYFSKGKLSSYAYVFNEYNRKSGNKHLEWLERVSLVEQFEQKMLQTHKLSIFGHWKEIKQSYYIEQINSIQGVSEKLKQEGRRAFVFNCSYQERESENGQLAQFLKNIFLEFLNQQFYCTNNHSLMAKNSSTPIKNSNQVFINAYSFDAQFDKAQLQHKIPLDTQTSQIFTNRDPEQNSQFLASAPQKDLYQVYMSNFMNYINRQPEYWSQSSVISVFSKNSSGFVFIMNNETNSKSLFEHYKQIKQKLNLEFQLPSVKFYHSDLSATPQQTTRIKKHIFGIEISVKATYPYPALAYIKPSLNYVQKYIFPVDLELTPAAMKLWIFKVLLQVQKINQNQINSSQLTKYISQNPLGQSITVKQHFRTTPEELFPTRYVNSFDSIYYNNSQTKEEKDQKLKIPEKFFINRRQLKPINFRDLEILLSSVFKESFFFFVNSRNDFKSYQLYTEISQWIQEDQDYQETSQSEEQQPQEQHPEQENNQKDHVQGETQPQKQLNTNEKAVQIKNQIKNQNEAVRILQQIKKEIPLHQGPKNDQEVDMEKVQKQKIDHTQQKDHKMSQSTKIRQVNKEISQSKQAQSKETVDKLTEEDLFKLINLFILNFNSNDYPPSYTDINGKVNQIQIDYFPSLLYFSNDKTTMSKVEGVQDIEQIKEFIASELFKNQDKIKGKAHEKLTEREDKGSEDRELEGKITLNLQNSQN